MSEQNIALVEEVGKLLGDNHAGKLARTVADVLRLERKNAQQSERERIITALKEYAGEEMLISVHVAIALIKNIKGENNASK